MSARKEKKEQKLREQLKKQGFSQEEIEKLVKAQRKKTTAKVVVGTLATAIVVAGVVFTVATVMKNNENNVTPTPTPTPTPDPTPDPDPIPDPTPEPTPEEIEKSKELEEEIKKDVEDKKPEDIDTKIDDKQNELDAAQKELEDLKNNPDASEEEIAAAEEKQKQAEEQLEAAKEEQNYWTITSVIKDLYNNNFSNSEDYPNSYIRNIANISYDDYFMVVETDIVSKDANNLLRQHRVVMQIQGGKIQNFEDSNQLSKFFQDCRQIKIYTEINDEISEFENNYYKNYLEKPNFKLEAANTIYNKEGDLDEVVFKIRVDQQVRYYKYDLSSMSKHFSNEEIISMVNSGDERVGRYMSLMKNCCQCEQLNYDWENATIEYKGQKTEEQQTEEQEAEELLNSFSTFDENGELETFDYPAYQQYLQQMQAEKEAKELEQNMTQETKVTYSEQELGF